MARLDFVKEHNCLPYILKHADLDDFHEMMDFLRCSTIYHALMVNPTIYISHLQEFWSRATIQTADATKSIHSTIDGQPIIVTEASVREHLQLQDAEGISDLPSESMFEGLARLGYEGTLDKFTFYKQSFGTQWRYLIHTLQQCLSPKRTGWWEFSSNIATALICLSTGQKFNFSNMIFQGMLKNLTIKKGKFLMYPRFLAHIFANSFDNLQSHKRVHVPHRHSLQTVKRFLKHNADFSGAQTPLTQAMRDIIPENRGEAPEQNQPPTIAQPTGAQTPPQDTNISSAHIDQATPQTSPFKCYQRKKQRTGDAPSIPVVTQEPNSPAQEHSPVQNIEREQIEDTPNLNKEVINPSEVVHMESVAVTTDIPARGVQDSDNIDKTTSMATEDVHTSTGNAANDIPKVSMTVEDIEASMQLQALTKPLLVPIIAAFDHYKAIIATQGKQIESMQQVITAQQQKFENMKQEFGVALLRHDTAIQHLIARVFSSSAQPDASKKGRVFESQPLNTEVSGRGKGMLVESPKKKFDPTAEQINADYVLARQLEEEEKREFERKRMLNENPTQGLLMTFEGTGETDDEIDDATLDKLIAKDMKGGSQSSLKRKRSSKPSKAEHRKFLINWHTNSGKPRNIVSNWTAEQLQSRYDEENQPAEKKEEESGKTSATSTEQISEAKFVKVRKVMFEESFKTVMKMGEALKEVSKLEVLKKPNIIFWRPQPADDKNLMFEFVVKRERGEDEVYKTAFHILSKMTREELTAMYRIGKSNYSTSQIYNVINLMETLACVLEPEVLKQELDAEKDVKVLQIDLYEKSMTYRLKLENRTYRYFALEFLDHAKEKLQSMKDAKIRGDNFDLEKKLADDIKKKLASVVV